MTYWSFFFWHLWYCLAPLIIFREPSSLVQEGKSSIFLFIPTPLFLFFALAPNCLKLDVPQPASFWIYCFSLFPQATVETSSLSTNRTGHTSSVEEQGAEKRWDRWNVCYEFEGIKIMLNLQDPLPVSLAQSWEDEQVRQQLAVC